MSLTDDKWVRIMADYCAEAIWDREGASESIEKLPVSAGLRAALVGWQLWYDHDCPHDGTSWPDSATFSAVGQELAKAVKRELPEWEVIYFNESRVQNGRVQDRLEFEYPISL
jgi:hypothetical protein